MAQLRILLLCLGVVAVAVALLDWCNTTAAFQWRPITPQDLSIKAEDTGDAEADAAILFREGELYDNNPEGTTLKVYTRIKIFSDRGRRHGEVHLPYRTDLFKISDVEARTINPDGTTVEVDGKDILERVIERSADGVQREKVFSMPAVKPGAIIEYRYRQTYPKGFRFFALDLQGDLFIKELVYKIHPRRESRESLLWFSFNTPNREMFYPSDEVVLKIKAEKLQPFRREPLMPPELAVKMWGWLYYTDELDTSPEKYWPKYGRRMHRSAADATKPTTDIKRIIDAKTLSRDEPARKLATVYEDYIQTEIRNITFSPLTKDSGRIAKTNDTADQTHRRGYGTGREINRLFIAMARALGFDARVAELTSRDKSFFENGFADEFQFNSEVAAIVARDGSIEFFDPGTPFCPYGTLSWEKQGVPALVYDSNKPRFVETPIALGPKNSETRQMRAILNEDGKIDVEKETSFTGQQAMALRQELSEATEEEGHSRIKDLVREIHPGADFLDSSVRLSGFHSLSEPLRLRCSFSLRGFAARSEARFSFSPGLLNNRYDSLFKSPTRYNRIYFQYPWSEIDRVVIEIPEGYSPLALPDPIDLSVGSASYHSHFSNEGRRLVYERRLTVNAVILNVDQYPIIKEFFDRVNLADRTAIILRR